MSENYPIPTEMSRHVKMTIILMLVTCGLIGVWSSVAMLNSGVVAIGEVIPFDKVLTIQHLEGGIVSHIYVKDGQSVKKGDKLIELEQVNQDAELQISLNELTALEGMIKRLEAEKNGQRSPILPHLEVPAIMTQLELFHIRKEGLEKDRQILEQRVEQTQQEIQAHKAEASSLATMLATAKESYTINQELYKNRYIDKKKFLESQNDLADIEGRIGANTAKISQAKEKIIETRLQIVRMKNQWQNELLEELRKAQESYMTTLEKVKIAKERLKRTVIVSPDEGKVHGIRFNTIGGVVQPSSPLMNLIPTNQQLVVEAKISPDDVKSLHQGLIAHVRFTAYKQRNHQAIKGKVLEISPDTFKDERQGISYYKVKIVIDTDNLANDHIELYPGMLAQVEIVTGERSVLHYLLQPLQESFHRAFKEK